MKYSRKESSRKSPLILNPAIFGLFGPTITDKDVKAKAAKIEKIKKTLSQRAKEILKREKAVTSAEKATARLKKKQDTIKSEIDAQRTLLRSLKKEQKKTESAMQQTKKNVEFKHSRLKDAQKTAKWKRLKKVAPGRRRKPVICRNWGNSCCPSPWNSSTTSLCRMNCAKLSSKPVK